MNILCLDFLPEAGARADLEIAFRSCHGGLKKECQTEKRVQVSNFKTNKTQGT